jgi:hypothetical protein
VIGDLIDQAIREACGIVNVHGNSGETERGTWCTPLWLCNLMGWFDLDPCSNPRSHVQAIIRWMLENGDDGLRDAHLVEGRTFINPPYAQGSVLRWINAYVHTDFTFLLRFDPSTEWYETLIPHTRYLWFPRRKRINFEPPPGVKASTQTFPHALFMRNAPNAALYASGYVMRLGE